MKLAYLATTAALSVLLGAILGFAWCAHEVDRAMSLAGL